MSETLEHSAEIAKLARLLDVDAHDLTLLDGIPSAGLREFRAQVTDRMFGGDGAKLKRVALSSKLLPIPLTVKIAQLAFGPMLCAAAAGLLEPERAARISSKVPVPFLADIAVHLDPRRAAEVIAAVPAPVVVEVAQELLRRREYVTMGRFVNYLPRATLAAAVPEISDDADLLRVAFVMEGKDAEDALDDLVEIARPRFSGLIRTAHTEDLWAEALDLISRVHVDRLAELGEIAAQQSTPLLDSLIEAVQRMDLWDVLLPVLAVLDPASLRRLAAVPAVVDSGVLHDIAQAALEQGLWRDLLPLSRYLTDAARSDVAGFAAAQDDAALGLLAEQAHDADMWSAMLPIAVALPEDARTRLARLPLLQRDDVLAAIVRTTAENDLWDDVLPLVGALPADTRPRLAACIGELGRDQLLAGLAAAATAPNLPSLVEIAVQQEPAGRRRVLEVVAEADRLDQFTQLLTRSTPGAVWHALIEVRRDLPDRVRLAIRTRAAELNKADAVALLTAPPQDRARPRPRPTAKPDN